MHTRVRVRYLLVLLVALLATTCLSFALPSRAAWADQGGMGSITLTLKNRNNDVALKSGIISLYRVATIDWSGDGPRYDVSGGQFAGASAAADIADLTQEELDEQNEPITNRLVRYAITNDIDPIISCAVTSDSVVRFAELDMGLYLVRQTKLSQDRLTMNPFLMSVPFEGQMDVVAYPKPGNGATDPIHPGEEDWNPEEPIDPENPDNPDDPENPDNPGDSDDPDNPGNPDNPDDPDNPQNPTNPTDEPGNPDTSTVPGEDGSTPTNPSTTTVDGDNVTRVSGSTIVGSRTPTSQSGSTTVGGHVPQTGDALLSVGVVAVAGVAGLAVAVAGAALRNRGHREA